MQQIGDRTFPCRCSDGCGSRITLRVFVDDAASGPLATITIRGAAMTATSPPVMVRLLAAYLGDAKQVKRLRLFHTPLDGYIDAPEATAWLRSFDSAPPDMVSPDNTRKFVCTCGEDTCGEDGCDTSVDIVVTSEGELHVVGYDGDDRLVNRTYTVDYVLDQVREEDPQAEGETELYFGPLFPLEAEPWENEISLYVNTRELLNWFSQVIPNRNLDFPK